jgi:F-type H+-transporting ATPase subunit epsilon
MAEQIELEVATPERQLVSDKVSEVQAPAKNGYMGILPGHAPLMALLGTGALSYLCGGKRRYLAVQGGFIEVSFERVRILANLAERAEDIDMDRARADLERSQRELGKAAEDPQGVLDAVALAQARVAAGEHRQP